MKKKYTTPKEETTTVNDPAAIYNSLSTPQAKERSGTNPNEIPCQYTIEELTESAEDAILEYKEGKGTAHELIKRKTL